MKEMFSVDLKGLFKGLILSIVGTALILCLFFIAYSLVFNLVTSNPEKIKEIAEKSSLYEDLPAAIYDQAAQEREGSLLAIPLKDPEVRQIALEVYDPSFAQSGVENLIDGLYGWLNGDTPKPLISIDLARKNGEFAEKLGKFAEKKADKLPPCNAEQRRKLNETNVFQAKCWPRDIRPAQAGEDVKKILAGDGDSILNTDFKADDLKTADGEPIDQSLSNLPHAFSLAKSVLPALIVMAGILVIIIFYLSKGRLNAIKRLSRVFLAAGIFIALIPLIFSFVLGILLKGSSENDKLKDIIRTLLEQYMNEAGKIYYTMGILLVLAAMGLYIYARKAQNSSDKITKAKG